MPQMSNFSWVNMIFFFMLFIFIFFVLLNYLFFFIYKSSEYLEEMKVYTFLF